MSELEALKRRAHQSKNGTVFGSNQVNDILDIIVDIIDYLIAERKAREDHDNSINISDRLDQENND